MAKGNKIKTFKKLILEGKTKEEAMQLSGASKGTAAIIYSLMKKNGELGENKEEVIAEE